MGLPDLRKSATASRISSAFAQPPSTMPTSRSTAPTRLSAFALRSCSRRLASEFGSAPKKRVEISSAFVKSGRDPSTFSTTTLFGGISGSLRSDITKSARRHPTTNTNASTITAMIKATLPPRVITYGLLPRMNLTRLEKKGRGRIYYAPGLKKVFEEAGADGRGRRRDRRQGGRGGGGGRGAGVGGGKSGQGEAAENSSSVGQ